MGRWTIDGKSKGGTESEEFHNAMQEAGPVECKKCKIRYGQGNRGQTMNVCQECLDYFCNDHLERHDNCSEGR
ncbi:hypothetical protein LCGC14_1748780 [marine sediment metagenome]|uniref:Uncharacterized protein n=1 Tax=marine sediment metagenome TaxID=412755 RepID=A0A0F9K3Y6_9ZZZZ